MLSAIKHLTRPSCLALLIIPAGAPAQEGRVNLNALHGWAGSVGRVSWQDGRDLAAGFRTNTGFFIDYRREVQGDGTELCSMFLRKRADVPLVSLGDDSCDGNVEALVIGEDSAAVTPDGQLNVNVTFGAEVAALLNFIKESEGTAYVFDPAISEFGANLPEIARRTAIMVPELRDIVAADGELLDPGVYGLRLWAVDGPGPVRRNWTATIAADDCAIGMEYTAADGTSVTQSFTDQSCDGRFDAGRKNDRALDMGRDVNQESAYIVLSQVHSALQAFSVSYGSARAQTGLLPPLPTE